EIDLQVNRLVLQVESKASLASPPPGTSMDTGSYRVMGVGYC
ncbi:hypothetical protein LINPERHAP1_LOCUS18506, partial [Linum perenne]